MTATLQGSHGGPDMADLASHFAARLRAAGLPTSPDRTGRFVSAMVLAPPARLHQLYWLARVTLVTDHGSLDAFDSVFTAVFGGVADPAEFRGDAPTPPPVRSGDPRRGQQGDPARPGSLRPSGPSVGAPDAGQSGEPADRELWTAAFSPDERLRHQDFAQLTPEELAQVRLLASRLALTPPIRPGRRRTRHHRGRELAIRATLRRARRTGGEPLDPVRRHRRPRPRRVVLLCDISGSMEPFARIYLQLLVSGVRGARAEAFVFATRLTRLTGALRGVSPDAALERAGRTASDWSGGTRVGEALKVFNDRYGRRGIARGAVVVVLSDGWDTGDPRLVAQEMDRLRRLAFRIVWVNPRAAAPGYAPLAGGMAAALGYVDAFVSGHSLAALDEVLQAITG